MRLSSASTPSRPPGPLQLTAQYGEGGTQFVAGSATSALPRPGSLQPGQQLVHRDRKYHDFVPRPGDLDARCVITSGTVATCCRGVRSGTGRRGRARKH